MIRKFACYFTLCCLVASLQIGLAYGAEQSSASSPEIIEVVKIWESAQHNAFTDLIRFNDKWYCTFRECDKHVYGKDGTIRVIVSNDGSNWKSAALLKEKGIDLRDPKLSITPDDRLMLLMGGSVYQGKKLVSRQPRVVFSTNGKTWAPIKPILSKGDWLWRVTWHKGRAYGTSYDITKEGWAIKLFSSLDGIKYDLITELEVTGKPNETTLRFLDDDTMVALIRREGENRHAWIGSSKPPYTQWNFNDCGHQVGGPNFIVLPDSSLWASGRSYPGGAKTVVAKFGLKTYDPVLTLPSGGDTSYPGMVWHEGMLWMSYYASHESRTSIYLAKIKLP